MRTFILVGRSRETGEDVLICDRIVPIREQLEKRKELARSRVNDEFLTVDMVEFVPAKTKLKFITTDEQKAEKKRAAAALKEKQNTENGKSATKANGKKAKGGKSEGKEEKPDEGESQQPEENSPEETTQQ